MPTYLVTYDLSAPGRNYDDLIEHLKSYGTYSHSLQSTWFIVTSKTAEAVREAADAYLDANDKILVAQVSEPGAWRGLRQATTEWLQRNL